ncbi:MAG: DUF2336 domain-containing protein [Alphaproteobacteria bacterium]|nr:DUF2336 domain-containing protein [Alphaproteobacteria bacterium]MDP1670579.1 DUF2336 domain-containing protein [Alphaproteobacteria bacterium]
MIERLIELAKDKRPAARRALSLGIVELCHNSGLKMDPKDKEIAGQIIIRLIAEFEIELRAQIADRLGASEQAPKALILALAKDEIIVADAVITHSPLLDNDDLIAIINSKTREHRLLVAARPHISAEVGDALLKPGEPEVLAALLNNQSAEISLAALEYAAEESRSWTNLQEPLVTRADLPPQLARMMVSFVSSELKRQLALKFPQDQEIVSQAVHEVAAVKAAAANGIIPGLSVKAAALIERLQANGELNITRVVSFLREKRLPLFFAGMAALTRLSTQSLVHFAFDSESQGLAVICRAAGADRGQFVMVVLLLEQARNGGAVPPRKLQAVCRLFDSLSEVRAHEILQDWRTGLHDPEYRVAAI